MTAGLPTGQVTLLFTDVEGSTRLWELHGDRMLGPLEAHEEILERAVTDAGGVLQRNRAEGDSGFAVFADPRAAIEAAIALQVAMAAHPWPADLRIRTRAALHTGVVELRGETYYGPVVNRCVKLRALAHGAQTILSKATADALASAGGPPAGAVVADLGTHRLTGLAVPERVSELRHPSIGSDFPPLRSPDVERHNLPERHGRFIGRSQEQRAVTKALEVERLVTLVGTGGVGKTRMSLEVAWARAGNEADGDPAGTWFADLTGARSDQDVDAVLAAAVGVREQPGRPLLGTVADQLGDSAALVVLDNCEHLVGAARRVARELLDRCPNLRILATSREGLGLEHELLRPVPGLPLADSVELFLERSGLDPVAMGEDGRDALERLCDRLDGIPFAIEIAAARAEAIGPAAVEEGVLRAQVEEAGTSVLQATLAWSHGLLEPEEQVLFRRLGVFAGAFTLDGAEAVTAGDPLEPEDVLDLLAALVERSLVHRTEGGYRQLVVVREWAAELAEAAAELDALTASHLRWCLDLALTVQAAGLDERDRVERLRFVTDDLIAALDRPFAEEAAALQVQLAGALEEFWLLRGAYAEGRSRLEELLRRGAGFRSHRAAVHRSAGVLAKIQGDLTAAETHLRGSQALLDEILAELREAESPHLPLMEEHQGATLLQLSEVLRLRGDPSGAAELARMAQGISAAMAAVAGFYLARAEHSLGEVGLAVEHLMASLATAEASGDSTLVADCLRYLGVVARNGGDLATAEQRYREALQLDRAGAAEWRIAQTLLSLAEVAALAGRDASDLLEEGLALARAVADPMAEAHGLFTLADVVAARDPGEAASLHRAALALRSRVAAPNEQALSRLRLAALAEMEGNLTSAAQETSGVAETFRSLGDDRGVVEALAQLARLEARSGRFEAAAAALAEAVARSEQVPTELERADLLEAAAWLAQDRPAEARGLLEAASSHRSGIGAATPAPAAAARRALEDVLADGGSSEV